MDDWTIDRSSWEKWVNHSVNRYTLSGRYHSPAPEKPPPTIAHPSINLHTWHSSQTSTVLTATAKPGLGFGGCHDNGQNSMLPWVRSKLYRTPFARNSDSFFLKCIRWLLLAGGYFRQTFSFTFGVCSRTERSRGFFLFTHDVMLMHINLENSPVLPSLPSQTAHIFCVIVTQVKQN